ncbi:MAG TPA: hypothetical protein VKZ18_13385 [Polyangia bacterium]|nr:hypothetical protein [Polyangia bacterium]
MRIVRVLASICAVAALIMACVTGDPSASLAGDDYNDDVPAAPDLSTALPATRAEPALTLASHGPVFVVRPAPTSRLTTLDIFRPPRALG